MDYPEFLKIFLYYTGKPKDDRANSLAAEFLGRAKRTLPCESREIDPGRFDLFARHSTAFKILLDPVGKQFDSLAFAELIRAHRHGARDIVFYVGGADGLPPEWRPKADLLLSLSSMTFPHELARAMLAEQIFRAAAILTGHPYARH